MLESVGEVWESVLECGAGVGCVGKHGKVCLGCGERCETCVGVRRGEKYGQRWGCEKM